MKGKNTLRDKPFRYGGLMHDYTKDFYELTGMNQKCWCCGGEMKSHFRYHKSKPYVAVFRPLCRACAYRYGHGVIECDGNTYMEPDEFSEKKWKENEDENCKR